MTIEDSQQLSMDWNDATQKRWLMPSVAAILLLLLFAILRLPYVGLPCLNPDEAQYLAFASYLDVTGQSAFERPLLHVFTHWIYHQAAEHYGNYNLVPIRYLTTILCGVTVFAIYFFSLRVSGVFAAFLAAAFFLYESSYFEGFSSNREWFSIALTLLGWWLYFITPKEKGYWTLTLSGLAIGSACWFKEQFVLMSIAIALDLLYRGTVERSWRRAWTDLGFFVLGGILSVAAFAFPMLLEGTFSQQWNWLFRVELSYAGVSESESTANRLRLLLAHLYDDVPYRILILASGFGWLLAFLRLIRSMVFGIECPRVPKVISVSVLYLPLAIVAFQLGGHFRLHYYLFLLPPLAILLGYFIKECMTTTTADWEKILLLTLWLMALCLDVTQLPSEVASQTFVDTGEDSGVGVIGGIAAVVLGTLGLAAAAKYPPADLWTRIIVGLASLPPLTALALLAISTHLAPEQAMIRGFSWTTVDRLSDHLARSSQPRESLFVWGWRPEIYVQSGLAAATPFCTSLDLLRNSNHNLETQENFYAPYADELIQDLEVTKPRWIVDAWLRSLFGGTMRIDYYPPLANYLARNYKRTETIDGCFVYERLDEPRQRPENVLPPIEESLAELDRLLENYSIDPHLRLTKGDILAQEGKYDQALEIYAALEKDIPAWILPKQRLEELQRLQKTPSKPLRDR